MIILKSMAPKLSKRYASADEMFKDLEEFRKNPSISFKYNPAELQTTADEGPDGATRKLPGGTTRVNALDAKSEAETRKRIRKELIDEENNKTRKSGNMIATLSAVLGVLALVAILGFVIIGLIKDMLNQPEAVMVDVPHLRNTMYSDDLLNEHRNLRFEIEEIYDSSPKGTIIDQDPLSVRQVPEGTVIKLTVSLGPEPKEPVTLVDMTDWSLQDAKNWFDENSIKYTERNNSHDTISENRVISTDPAPDTTVYKGDTVTIIVSRGPDAIPMPDLVGKKEDEALAILSPYGLRIGTVTSEPSDNPKDTIIRQSVPAGDPVEENAAIDIVISEGSGDDPDYPPTPDNPNGNGELTTPEPVYFIQPILIPTRIDGVTTLTVWLNSGMIYQEEHNSSEGTVNVPITGIPSDNVTVYFDGTLEYLRTIEALLQQQ
jgi:serine/threonine-protein kinase